MRYLNKPETIVYIFRYLFLEINQIQFSIIVIFKNVDYIGSKYWYIFE